MAAKSAPKRTNVKTVAAAEPARKAIVAPTKKKMTKPAPKSAKGKTK